MKLNRWELGISLLLTIVVLVKTFPLKTISYDHIPKVGETFDEYSIIWTGMGLRFGGLPVSWTTNLGVYQKYFLQDPRISIQELEFDYGLGKRHISLVKPYLDQPPLGGLIYSLGIPQNTSLMEIGPQHFRWMTRWLSLLTAGLLFLAGAILYRPLVGLMATAFYSTLPSTLFPARLTLLENILIPLLLLTLIFAHLAFKQKRLWLFALTGVTAGLCILTKLFGLSALLAVIIVAWQKKLTKRQWLVLLLPALGVAGMFPLYGLLTAPKLFIDVMLSQAGRGQWGAINLYQSIERLFFLGFPLDGWWTGGFVVLAYLARKVEHYPLVIFAFVYALVATILGGDNNPWYFFPLGVFFVLGYANLIDEIIFSPTVVNLTIMFLFPVMSSLYWGYLRLHPQLNLSWPVRILAMGMIIGGLVLPKLLSKNKVWTIVWTVLIILLVHRLYLWNFRSVQYILSTWNQLPYPLVWTKTI